MKPIANLFSIKTLCAMLAIASVFTSVWVEAGQGLEWDKSPSAAAPFGHSISRPAPSEGWQARPHVWLADNEGDFRSKADVIREVKRRYNARVLKITLNEKREVYRVRVLMPSGKIRNVRVSARR